MKKMFSSLLSFTLSAAVLTGGCLSASAQETDTEFEPIVLTLGELEETPWLSGSIALLSDEEDDGSYYYGDALDANNRAVYDALMKLRTPSTDKITITLPEPATFTTSTNITALFSDDEVETYTLAVFGNCKPGIDSLLFDHPEIFWFDAANSNIAVGSDTKVSRKSAGVYQWTINSIAITPNYSSGYSSLNDVNDYKERLEEAVEEFAVPYDTRYETIKALHDKISEFTYYDTAATFSDSPVGAVVEPGVVCEGYSEAFKLCCDSLGIPCVLVFGNYNTTANTAHMWNYVQMEDGKWYAVDVTWDDLDNESVLKYTYLLKGSESFNTNHTPSSDYNITQFTYPELSKEDYVFTAPVEYQTGDLNRDSELSVADLVYCSNAVLGEAVEYSCDVNGDEKTNTFDLIFMRKLIFPA